MDTMHKRTMKFNGNEIVFTDTPNCGIAGIANDQPEELAEEIVNRWNQHTCGVGMYGETPRVQIGKFSLCRQDDNSVWLEIEGEEGQQIGDAVMEADLQEIFDKRF